MSPLGPQHLPDEMANAALGRIAYQKLVGHDPTPETKQVLAKVVHIGYGLLVASLYGALRGRSHHAMRDGTVFGIALWLGSELAVPLLGLADRPSEFPPSHHAQSLATHVGFGVATAATARALGGLS